MALLNFPFAGSLYQAEQTRRLDQIAIDQSGTSGFQLMQRAGACAYSLLQAKWPNTDDIVILCGAGNNGGDGLVMATLAWQENIRPHVLMIGGEGAAGRLKGEALDAYQAAVQAGVEITAYDPDQHFDRLMQAGLIVDAMLGTGLSGDVRGDYESAIDQVNESLAPVLSIDIPSGICSDTGRILGIAVKADVTISFIGLKRGLMTHHGLEYRGELFFDDLGVDRNVYQQVPSNVGLINDGLVHAALPARPVNSHKGTTGHLLIIAGGEGMAGAGLMAAEAALHTGPGLVTLATHPANVSAANVRTPEVMAVGVRNAQDLQPLLARADVILIGPGLGQTAWAENLVQAMVHDINANLKPSVWDADGLNLLSSHPDWQKPDPLRILTPHPGEAARLMGCSTAEIQEDRFAAVTNLQKAYGGVAMLKGAGSLVASSEQTWLCQSGNPGMATGGMGDVLAGIIAGLYTQGLTSELATAVGVQVHAQAADRQTLLTGQRGLRATALFNHLGRLLNPSQFNGDKQ